MTKLLLALAILIWSGCSDSTSSADLETRAYAGTQSPGDVWQFTINTVDNTVTGTSDRGTPDNDADDFTATFSYISLDSGYLRMTLTAVEPIENKPSNVEIGAKAYGIEAPGLSFVVKPVNGAMISSVFAGSCDGFNGDYNYVRVAYGDSTTYDLLTEEAYGIVAVDASDLSNVKVTGAAHALDGTKLNDIDITGGSCDAGVIRFPTTNGAIATGVVSKNGGFVLDLGPSNGGVAGFKHNSLTLAEISQELYNGVVIQSGGIFPVQLEFSAEAVGLGVEWYHVGRNIKGTDVGVTIRLNSINNGLIDANLINGAKVRLMVGASFVHEGTTSILLVATDEDSSPFTPYNVLMTSFTSSN